MCILLQGWLLKRDAMEGEALRTLYHKSFQELLIFMTENVTPKMELLECNYIAQVRKEMKKITQYTQCHLNVHTVFSRRSGRSIDVETTLCV